MDPFYAFLVFAVILVLEQAAGHAWLPAYYRIGIPVFISRQAVSIRSNFNNQGLNVLVKAISPAFQGNLEHPSIQFRVIAPHQVALREALFENKGGFRYMPVMHSILRLHSQRGSLTITGYLNGAALIALVYLFYRALTERSFVPVAALILFVLVFSYAAQAAVNRRILHSAAQAFEEMPGAAISGAAQTRPGQKIEK